MFKNEACPFNRVLSAATARENDDFPGEFGQQAPSKP